MYHVKSHVTIYPQLHVFLPPLNLIIFFLLITGIQFYKTWVETYQFTEDITYSPLPWLTIKQIWKNRVTSKHHQTGIRLHKGSFGWGVHVPLPSGNKTEAEQRDIAWTTQRFRLLLQRGYSPPRNERTKPMPVYEILTDIWPPLSPMPR